MSGILVLIFRILSALGLYAFIGYALYIIWQDIRSQSYLLGRRKTPSIMLIPLDSGIDQTSQFRLAEIIIGRMPECDLPITNNTVSSQHARLSFHHNQWWIEDLNSKNGTFLNDERVYTPTVAISNDELRCGGVSFKILIEDTD